MQKVTTGAMISIEELQSLPDDGNRYEIRDGRLRTMPPTAGWHDEVGARLASVLLPYVYAHRLGRCTLSQAGYRVKHPDKPELQLWVPDLAFVRADRVPSPSADGYWEIAPDLVVEVVSKSSTILDVAADAKDWLAAGVRLVWILWRDTQRVQVWRPGRRVPDAPLAPGDMLSGEDVVPGFSCPVAFLFE